MRACHAHSMLVICASRHGHGAGTRVRHRKHIQTTKYGTSRHLRLHLGVMMTMMLDAAIYIPHAEAPLASGAECRNSPTKDIVCGNFHQNQHGRDREVV